MGIVRVAACGAMVAIALVSAGSRAEQHGGASKSEKEKHAPLNGFYIVTLSVADAADASPPSESAPAKVASEPAWRDRIVDVLQDGTGILIREITIEPAVGPHCPPHAVIARERDRALPGDSVDQAAGRHHLCSLSESDVAGVIQAANKDDVARENSDDLETQTIVATCGEREHLFELPYPDTLKFHALGLADPHITALWKMSHEVIKHAFGDEPFPPAQAGDTAAQQLAEKLVPEIRDGRYASGFGDSNCAYASCRDHSAKSALEGYAGVIDPATCAAPTGTPATEPPPTQRGTNDR